MDVSATAGLRLLPPEVSRKLLEYTQQIFESFRFKARVGIIEGQDEGKYLWAAFNFLLGKLEGDGRNTVGSHDLGGGSTQLAFFPNGPFIEHNVTVRVPGRKFVLYSASYLGYGRNSAREKMIHSLSVKNSKRKV